MSESVDTWTWRELPILRIAVRDADAGAQFEDIAAETGLELKDVWHGAKALQNAGYLDAALAGAFSGFVVSVSERARREIGSWPSPESIVDRLVEAFADAATEETEPEKKKSLRTVAEGIGGVGRALAAEVIASVLRQAGHLP